MKRNYHSNLAFLDLLFNTLLCFVALFAIAILIIKPKEQNKKVDIKAEFIIVATWPGEMEDDVDLYVEDPSGNVVHYRKQDAGLMHLDRDDLGKVGDTMITESGKVEYADNREMVTVRGVEPGEYIVNVHAFTKKTEDDIPVTVTVDKLNPFGTVASKVVTLNGWGQEKTVIRFVLDSDGEVVRTNELQKSFLSIGW
jgi:hypothetical protein